jgi:signal transduction histidine kinase
MRANHNHHDTATIAPDEQTEGLQATILALQETNRRLEQELQDLTVELAATTDEFVRATEEVKRAKEEAERASTIKSAFLASMSHELRTPLNAVINFTRFVIDGDTGPVNEQQAELLTEVVNSARHLLNLINDVLDMSKIESGTLNLFVEEEVDVNALLKSILTTGQSLLAGKPVRLEADIEQNLPLIRADRQRILQILLNIVSNACKFTDEGQITIRARCEGDEIVFGVIDTGPGIAPEDQALVFEAFKQTSTGLRQGGGTGLGMPIARNLAEAHGGRLWLTSVYGQGAEFYVAIPIKLDAAGQAALGGV